ncbi:MAG: hypothetical protein EAX95_07050 [Candidatus Thorarchaeota archaeon]|nr:hypothetical protein [Candidatus Thorarchaeota archaeon]
MRRRGIKHMLLSLVAVTIFLVSMFSSGVATSLPPSVEEVALQDYPSYRVLSDDGPFVPEPGTEVWWDQTSDSTSDEWSWHNRNWLFGPRPTFEVFHENGTNLDKNSYAEIGETLNIVVTVPKNAFGKDADLGEVNFHGYLETPYDNFTADFNLRFNTWDMYPWSVWTSTWNYTLDPWNPLPTTFIDLHTGLCSNATDGESYIINFAVIFNDNSPLGLFRLNMDVMDTNWNNIGSFNYGSGWEFQGIAVGMPVDLAYAKTYSGIYTLQKLDMAGDVLYSVSRGKDFIMRFNVTGAEVDYAMLGFLMPSMSYELVNVTGEHDELVTTNGGWQYDEILDTYVWNASVEVTYMRRVYGDYLERVPVHHNVYDSVYMMTWQEIYNETTMEWKWVYDNFSIPITRQFIFNYNGTTDDFTTSYGYTYWTYTYDEEMFYYRYDEYTVFESVSVTMPTWYELNTSLCDARQIGSDFVIDFTGHFTNEMNTADSSTLFFMDRVVDSDGYQLCSPDCGINPRQTSMDYQMAKQISIDIPVTIAKLLKEDGTAPRDYMFHVGEGEPFMVSGRLQGGGEFANDIDAVRFELHAYDSYWTEDEYGWSNIIYEIQYDIGGIPHLWAFNFTEKHNYTYGSYWDYVPVIIQTPDGSITSWQYMEIEDWHWEWYYFNQKTGEWQKDYIQYRSPETKISPDFCTTHEFTKWVDSGDLYISFIVEMNTNAPATNYWWDFAFMNSTWYQDTSMGISDYEILRWEQRPIYSFDYFGEKVFMGGVDSSQLAFQFTNGSLGTDWMVGTETPYIQIDSEKLPIEVQTQYDPVFGTYQYDILHFSHWDSATDRQIYYYELTNGSQVTVSYQDRVYIYNVTSRSGDSFLAASNWDQCWDFDNFGYFYWIDINGALHQGDSDYGQWNCEIEIYDEVPLDNAVDGWYIKYGFDSIIYVDTWWWSSADEMHYFLDTEGSIHGKIWNEACMRYQVEIDGIWYNSTDFMHYVTVDSMQLYNFNTHRFWYTDVQGVKHEMPYPGAAKEYYEKYGWALWEWELDHLQSDNGAVPATKYIVYNDINYVAYNYTAYDWATRIGGITYSLNMVYMPHALANGTDVWDPFSVGWTGSVGLMNDNLEYREIERIEYLTEDIMGQPRYDYINGYYVIDLLNGTKWVANDTDAMLVYEYDYNGQTFYTTRDWPYPIDDGNGTTIGYEWLFINDTVLVANGYEDAVRVASHLVYVVMNGTHTLFEFMSETYVLNYWGYSTWGFLVHNATYPGKLFLNMYRGGDPIYEFDYLGTLVRATSSFENIEWMTPQNGYPWVFGPAPIQSDIRKNYYDLVIGTPDSGMWGVQNWDYIEETGALDLDGDPATEDDQYYVLEEYTSTDSWTHDWDFLSVYITWDPNGTAWGDEMFISSWLGVDSFTWTYAWNQTFYWFDTDMTPISASEMQSIRDMLLTADDEPQPGYWDLSWMAKNVTWADIVAEAEENGWDWISSNEQSWTWLSFGISQDYRTDYESMDGFDALHIGMHYEFSGLMIWEDLNDNGKMDVDLVNPGSGELSHYLIPDSVGSVDFVTPGMAYGNMNSTDFMKVGATDEVTWGVAFYDVNGTVYPFTLSGYWGWYDGIVTGSDLRTFDERPTEITIDELSFLVHFQGHEDLESLNNYAEIKVDNYVGNWGVGMIGGRDNLENKSLALNYFADVHIDQYTYVANTTLQEQTVSAEEFSLEAESARFARMIMGGVAYDWGKDTTGRYDVVSYTTPLGTFRTAFESEAGQSATTWSYSSTMFYVTIGFPEWDGYSVYQDPVFVSYVSRGGAPGGISFGAFSIEPIVPTSYESVKVTVDISSDEEVFADLLYSTDQVNWQSVAMWEEYDGHYAADIPPHEEGTEVFFKVVVHSTTGDVESMVNSYIVGEGMVTTTTTTTTSTTTTTTTWTTNPWDGFSLDSEMILLIGSGLVIIVIAVLAKRRR